LLDIPSHTKIEHKSTPSLKVVTTAIGSFKPAHRVNFAKNTFDPDRVEDKDRDKDKESGFNISDSTFMKINRPNMLKEISENHFDSLDSSEKSLINSLIMDQDSFGSDDKLSKGKSKGTIKN
jgi:hypothetical protein